MEPSPPRSRLLWTMLADDSFDAVADQTVSATTTDDDVPGSRLINLMDL